MLGEQEYLFFCRLENFFLDILSLFLDQGFMFFIGILFVRLYQSNANTIFRFEKSWAFFVVWPVI